MQLTDHHKAILKHLLHGEAWKVVMHIYGDKLAVYERIIQQLDAAPPLRLEMLSRRNALLDLVKTIYTGGEEENPFDAAAGTLWATTLKLPAAEVSEAFETHPDDGPLTRHLKAERKRRNAGSVA